MSLAITIPQRPHAASTLNSMATLRMFAAAREAAGTNVAAVAGNTVGEVLDHAVERFGGSFATVLASCRIWVNGDAADPSTVVGDRDEVAVLPPVSGGCT